MSKWQEVSLGDVADFVTDKIAASNVTLDNYISTDNMQIDRGGVVTAATLPQASKFNHYKPTDTLFSNIRTYFRKVWLADRAGGASADVLIFRTKDKKQLNPLYLYYLISGQEFVDFTVLTAKGAKMPRGDKGAMMQFKLRLPRPDEQIDIAESLRCIDQKIELNQRMNETLEGMARAIFKSWFVDFDPVHAKAEGRIPEGMDSATAALFPSTFTPDGLPEGWGIGKVGDVAKAKGGYAFKSKDFTDAGNPVIKIKNITNDGKVVIEGSQCISDDIAAKADKFRLGDGDLVMAMTGATVGKSGLIVTTDSIPYLNQRVAKFESSKFGSKIAWFLFCLFKQEDIFSVLVGAAQGSAQPNISSSGIEAIKTVIPSDKVISAYCEVVDHLFKLWIHNEKQKQTLAALRDTLLPKLISGELRVDTATETLKAAV